MRHLLACTCLTPIILVMSGAPALAQRSISTRITTPVQTSTATNNAPDNVSVTSAGSIEVASGTAITVDSNNTVSNAGTLRVDSSDGTGILVTGARSGSITNSGRITLTENYEPVDTDKDGDLDGPFAQGARRFGIRIAPGSSFTGNVTNTGAIEIEGNQSAGIALDGTLTGSLNNSGSITVVGDDSVGIRADEVTGNVTVRGAVAVRGGNAVGVALDGDIGGAVTIQGTVSSTGYRAVTPPADTSKLDADDLLQGGPAVRIAGNVAGGIVFAVPPADADPKDDDEDDDGIPDAQEGAANILSNGAAAAIEIGSASEAITVGAVAGQANGHGLIVNGTIAGDGTYANVNGTAIRIGGLGANVTIAGGMTIGGTVTANSNGANATGVQIGSGASVPEIRVAGSIRATGGGDAGDLTHAVRVEQGATVTAIRNGGRIEAIAGASGAATAILDQSGGITLIENSNAIAASGGTAANAPAPVAIDLSANTSGATIRQTRATGTNTAVPRIVGAVRLGSGNDLFEVNDGSVAGRTSFGAGDNRLSLANAATYTGAVDFGSGADRLTLAGSSQFSGSVDFGGGADQLEVGGTARFMGSIANASGLNVAVNGGTLHVTQAAPVAIAGLSVGNNSVLGVDIDGAAGTSTRYDVAGAASFGTGTSIAVRLRNVSESEGRYVVVDAGSLTSAGTIGFSADSLPFLFRGTVDTNVAAGEVAINITRKTATELGLNRSAGGAYDAIFAVLDADAAVANVFLNIADGEQLRTQLTQLLPDHAGGTFEMTTLGSRSTARFLNDPQPPLAAIGGGWSFWLQQGAWGSTKDRDETASYDVSGWAASGGLERHTSVGSFGASLSYLAGDNADGDNDNHVRAEQFELAGYWRGRWGGLNLWARGSAATVNFDSTRTFTGVTADGEQVTRESNGAWGGTLVSAAAGASYDLRMGRFTLRPSLAIDYYRLSEDGYTEAGGGDAMDLIVDSRTSDELAGTLSLAAGLEWGDRNRGDFWLRSEIEGGRRQILAGELGETTARFGDGEDFTLSPEERADGWMGALRLVGGQGGTSLTAEVNAEELNGRTAFGGRISVGLGF